MRARSIDWSALVPSGASTMAPMTSFALPFVNPTQISTAPLLLTPFESQPSAPTLPGKQGCAAAVKPSGNVTGPPLGWADPLGSADPLEGADAVGDGATVTTGVVDGVGDGASPTPALPKT